MIMLNNTMAYLWKTLAFSKASDLFCNSCCLKVSGAPPVDVPGAEGYATLAFESIIFGALPEGLICGRSFRSVDVAFMRLDFFSKNN